MRLKSYIFYSFILILLPGSVFASETFSLVLPTKDVSVGDSFSVIVLANTPTEVINAVSGVLEVSGGAVSVTSISKVSSIVDFWTTEPKSSGNKVSFEGIVLSPGYQGSEGKLFNLILNARKEGIAKISFSEGALLANDGLGTNVIDSLTSRTIKINPSPNIVDGIPKRPIATKTTIDSRKIIALPVITEYSPVVDKNGIAFFRGKGEPNALTKIIFTNSSNKSLGEQFITSLQTKKSILTDILVKNDKSGSFEYVSPKNLLAGAYQATPYLVDEKEQTQKPGFGVKLLVNDSKIVKYLVILINILLLMIPIVGLLVLIYFIPWYSRLRMKLVQKRLHLEEKKIIISESELEHPHGHLFDER